MAIDYVIHMHRRSVQTMKQHTRTVSNTVYIQFFPVMDGDKHEWHNNDMKTEGFETFSGIRRYLVHLLT